MKIRGFSSVLLLIFYFSQAASLSAQTKKSESVPAGVAEVKNHVVVSIAGYDELRKSVLTVANKMNPALGVAAAGMMNPDNTPVIPKGIAKKGPIGLVIDYEIINEVWDKPKEPEESEEPEEPAARAWFRRDALAFAPITGKEPDFSGLLAFLSWGMPGNPEEHFDMKTQNGYVSLTYRETPIEAPKDPATLLGDLPSRYLAAIQINPSETDPKIFLIYMPWGRNSHSKNQAWLGTSSDFKQMNAVLAGVNVDSQTGDISLDVITRAKAGTELAAMLKKGAKVTPKLAGFYDPEAVIGFQTAILLPASILRMVEADLEPEYTSELTLTLFRQAAAAGKLDFAFSGYAEERQEEASDEESDAPPRMKGVLAVSITDAAAVEEALRKELRDDKKSLFASGEFGVKESATGAKIHTFVSEDGTTYAVALSKSYFLMAFNYEDNIAALKEKVSAMKKVPVPEADFQAHMKGEMFSFRVPEASGHMKITGTVTPTGHRVSVFVTPDHIMTLFLDAQQQLAQASARMNEWGRRRNVIREVYEDFDIPESFWFDGLDDVTLTFPSEIPQEEIDALVASVKKKIPKINIKTRIWGEE